ncbi:MAG: hypothetical protein MJE77_03885 [Proteobacteria bacterium]|nr:hypothetical protein [Pseudomonadota bacterium]
MNHEEHGGPAWLPRHYTPASSYPGLVGLVQRSIGQLLRVFTNTRPDHPGLTRTIGEIGISDWYSWPRDMQLGFGAWPLLAGCAAGIALLAMGLAPSVVGLCVLYGVALSLAGTFVCAISITVLGSAAAGAIVAIAFGLSLARIIELGEGWQNLLVAFQAISASDAILGGMAILVTPPDTVIVALTATVAAIGYLMAVSSSERVPADYPMKHRFFGIAIGVFVGAGLVGVTVLSSKLIATLLSEHDALLLSFLAAGSLPFALVTGLRNRLSRSRTAAVMGTHAAIWLILMIAVDGLPGTRLSLVCGGMAHVMFHGTFFAITYIIAERRGGPSAAGWACALEGCGGLLGFLASYHGFWTRGLSGIPPVLAGAMFCGGVLLLGQVGHVVGQRSAAIRRAVATAGRLIPAMTLVLVLAVFGGLHLVGVGQRVHYQVALWVHLLAICLLASFVVMGQSLLWCTRWQLRRDDLPDTGARTLRKLWALAELIPAPAAIAVASSGLSLIYHRRSASEAWLLIVIAVFAWMFMDGLTRYLPAARRLMALGNDAEEEGSADELRQELDNGVTAFVMFLHVASLPVLLFLGWKRPELAMLNRATELVRRAEHALSSTAEISSGAAAVLVSLATMAVVALTVLVGHLIITAYNRAKTRPT